MGDIATLITSIGGLITAIAGAFHLLKRDRDAERQLDALLKRLEENNDDDEPKRSKSMAGDNRNSDRTRRSGSRVRSESDRDATAN